MPPCSCGRRPPRDPYPTTTPPQPSGSASSISYRNAEAGACNPPGFHPHELRHTAASLAIASGADVKVIQQMLGHKSATMTLDLYGHLFGDRLDVVADAMDSARASALSGVYPLCTTGEVIELRGDAK
jgi:integrase